MITEENIDEYLLLYTDGELSAADEQALLAYLELHPEYKNDLAAYGATKQQPAFMAFPGKKALIKQDAAPGRVIFFRNRTGYGMAAGIAALFAVTFFFMHREKELAVNPVKQGGGTLKTNASKQELTTVTPPANAVPAKTPVPEEQIADIQKQNTRPGQLSKVALKQKTESVATIQPIMKQLRQADNIGYLEIAEVTPLSSLSEEPAPVSVISEPVAIETKMDIEDKKNLFDKLPIDDTKKEGMETLAENITGKFQHVSVLKKKLDEKNVTVRIEKRKLIISF